MSGGLCVAIFGFGSQGLLATAVSAGLVAMIAVIIARMHERRIRVRLAKQAMNAIETTQSNSEFDLGDVVIDPVFHDVLDQIRGIQACIREETASRQVSVARSDELLSVLHILEDPLFVFDAFGSIRLANEAAESLIGSSGSINRGDIRLVLEESDLRQAITQGLADGAVGGLAFECDYTMPNGIHAGVRTYDVRTLSLGEENEGPFVLVLHDLTHEREISRMKSDFVSKASHELRTPLSSIRAHLEMLVDGEAEGEEEQARFLSMMLEDTDRLASLVENMLNISRIEAGIVRPQLDQSDLGAIAERVAKRLEPAAVGKGISISVSPAPVDLSVEGDALMLQEVVENLVSNAIKYTPDGGRITVTVDTDPLEQAVLVAVSDTGLGIPPEARDRVFEKFFRIPSYERMARGTGLGLNLCRNIVESVHQGRIGVDSTVGEGSRFWFSVPVGFAGARAA